MQKRLLKSFFFLSSKLPLSEVEPNKKLYSILVNSIIIDFNKESFF